MQASPTLVREAFDAAGEKHFFLARAFYSVVFGRHWGQAILGFGYLKCLDDLVDEDPDAEHALAVLARQTEMIAKIYDHANVEPAPDPPERYGLPFFVHDRDHGAILRRSFECILATMEFDTRRRGQVLGVAQLDRYFVELGTAVLRFLVFFGAPGYEPPRAFLADASRAYLMADALIDVRHDLEMGVVNIPKEDIGRLGLSLEVDDPTLRLWMSERSRAAMQLFGAALQQASRLERRSLRVLARLYLSTKRRKLRRFLLREGLPAD